MTPIIALCALTGPSSDMDYLHQVAKEVTLASRVGPGGEISNGGKNTTGCAIRVPGGTQTYYPAFWVRDAAMMLGGDLVPADEVEGWIKVVAATQPGSSGLKFDHGLWIPPYSIPDHITLQGQACWFPGAYADQGIGNYGFLPPADDAFFFIQMVHEEFRLTRRKTLLDEQVGTGWGEHPLGEVCARAFESVAVDRATGLVVCDADKGKGRVDWGFCDSIVKTGSCLMPSLLRWQAARWLAEMCAAAGRTSAARTYRASAQTIQKSIVLTFFKPLDGGEGMLISATGLARKDDVWASAFAVWLGVLPAKTENTVSRHLLAIYKAGGTVVEGQVRQIPPTGEFGVSWDKALTGVGAYQNGGFWATPTGWMIAALHKVDRAAANKLLSEFTSHVRAMRDKGAPFEWINPATNTYRNGNYGSSAGLVYLSLKQAGF
ncbi:MAG: hypothetical protein ACHQ50_00170 [Fimbriimonadales bacterium]